MSKKTEELVEEFTDGLLNRKGDLYDTIDCLSHSDQFDCHVKTMMDEIDRIDDILKLFKNN